MPSMGKEDHICICEAKAIIKLLKLVFSGISDCRSFASVELKLLVVIVEGLFFAADPYLNVAIRLLS